MSEFYFHLPEWEDGPEEPEGGWEHLFALGDVVTTPSGVGPVIWLGFSKLGRSAGTPRYGVRIGSEVEFFNQGEVRRSA